MKFKQHLLEKTIISAPNEFDKKELSEIMKKAKISKKDIDYFTISGVGNLIIKFKE